LDSIRNDIYKNKKLNYHYYMSLKKSIYKPQSFFKGILLPLCQENCTLREAAIVASVLQRVSIPVHHAAVAIHKLATMHQVETTSAVLMSEYSGATSIFLKTLFNKKYSLPAPVISSVIRYFTNFLHTNTGTGNHKSNGTTGSGTTTVVLPVLWHQALLVFIQRYKNAIRTDDVSTRETFRKLLKQHYHHKITPEIRRELFGSIQAYQEELREKSIAKGTTVGSSVPTSIMNQPMEM
jgi:essential nuclear protein 1